MSFLTRASLKNRLIVVLATLGVAVLGLFSMGALKQELMPSMTVPMGLVSVQTPGLAPEDMAETVTKPIEQAVTAVPGVTRVTSTTYGGEASVVAEWSFDENAKETLRTIRAAADAVKPALPTGTEVQTYSGGFDGAPAMMLSAGTSGDQATFDDSVAQTVVPALQGVSGVQRVELSGREEQRIAIDLRPADVKRLKVDTAQIAPILEAHGAGKPAGQADSAKGTLSVTVGSALGAESNGDPDTMLAEVAALPLPVENGVVSISDFADVRFESVPQQSLSRVNGKPSLTLSVMPAQGANVVEISKGVNAELDRLGPELDAEFVPIFDQAPYIEQSIEDLSVEGGLGLLFAVLVILAFLASWRSTVIAALSIPLSLLITLVGLWWSGNTLNILTLGALTIAIGRVVDDSIVVIENITRRRGSGPLEPEGVVASVRQVAGAITASTLTTVAVFLPIAFVSGMTGQLFRPFAITVSIALLASLFVALTVVPVLAYWFMRGRPAQATSRTATHASVDEIGASPAGGEGGVTAATAPESDLDEIHTAPDRLQRAIMPTLNTTRRHPIITLLASGLILIVTLALAGFIPTDFLGSSGSESIQLTQTLPEQKSTADQAGDAERGTPGADLIAAAEPVERALAQVTGVRDVITTIPVGGGSASGAFGAPNASAGVAPTITYAVQLEEGADAAAVSAQAEQAVRALPNAGEFNSSTQDAFTGGSGDGISLQIRGTDPAALREASDLLKKSLVKADGVKAVTSDLTGEQPVVSVELDDAKATRLGFDRASVATAVQAALQGQQVGQLLLGGQERTILLRTPGSERTAEKLGEIVLPVTVQQTAAAQQAAADALKSKAEVQAEEARLKANSDLTAQLNEAAAQRSELASQLGTLNAQLAELMSAPIMPEEPRTPEEDAVARAQQERAAQIEAIQSAIAGAQGGIEGANQQIAGLREAQSQSATQLAEQQAAEAEQKSATEVTGTAIRLSDIATVKEKLTPPTITRADGDRQVALTVTPQDGQLDAANLAIAEAIQTIDLPAGVSFELGGVSADQADAFAQLGFAMLAAIMLVLLVMVATFRSFRGPLVLLISVPFAATGAILGLFLTNTPLGLPALIGLLMLIGIVVTNAIVLMDLVNRLRMAGASLDEAIEHGTRLRLRPILMTAAATIFALVPMSLGLTGGGVFISRPLAIVVIGGLISSTLLTLVLVPVLYTLIERRRERKLAKREARRARTLERLAEDADAPAEARAAQRDIAEAKRAAREGRRAERRAAKAARTEGRGRTDDAEADPGTPA